VRDSRKASKISLSKRKEEHGKEIFRQAIYLYGKPQSNKRMRRTVVLRGDYTLSDLHEIAFDRFDEHLYSFYFPKAVTGGGRFDFQPKEYSSPIMLKEHDPFSPRRPISTAKTTLDSLHLPVGRTFEHFFDFGDNWLHDKVVSKEPVSGGDQIAHDCRVSWGSPCSTFCAREVVANAFDSESLRSGK